MTQQQFRRARTGLVVLVTATVLAMTVLTLRQERAMASTLTPTPTAVATTLIRVNLGAEALAAAGLAVGEVSNLVSRAEEYLALNEGSITLADEQFADAKRARDRLERLVRSGQATEENLADYAAAKAAFATARSARAAQLEGFLADAVMDLAPIKKTRLANLRANAEWAATTEFKVVTRTEPDWLALDNALANERISAKRGVAADQDAQALLQQLRADPAVSAAKASLDANLAAIENAWAAAVGLE